MSIGVRKGNMAWIELHTVLSRHRKIKKFARELDIDLHVAVGHVVLFWGSVLELAEDGNITKWTLEDIAEYSNYAGDPQMFYKAMINDGDGWIDEKDGLKIVHDWWDYAGRYLTTKYRNTHPEKLDYIKGLYNKTVSRRSIYGLQTDNLPNLPNHIYKLTSEFYTTYQQKVSKAYVQEPHKDRAIIKMLLKTMSNDDISEAIKRFFASSDPFIERAGYTIGVFKSQVNRLMTSKPKQEMNAL